MLPSKLRTNARAGEVGASGRRRRLQRGGGRRGQSAPTCHARTCLPFFLAAALVPLSGLFAAGAASPQCPRRSQSSPRSIGLPIPATRTRLALSSVPRANHRVAPISRHGPCASSLGNSHARQPVQHIWRPAHRGKTSSGARSRRRCGRCACSHSERPGRRSRTPLFPVHRPSDTSRALVVHCRVDAIASCCERCS